MQTMTRSMVNGIDVEALRSMIDQVGAVPAKGMAKFEVATRWMGGTSSETEVEAWELGGERLKRGFAIRTDEPAQLCGRDMAPNPQEVLMAAVNACMMVGYVAVSAMMGVELEKLEIRTSGTLDLRGFLGIDQQVKPGYEGLDYTVVIKGNGTPEQFRQIHDMVMATSPNFSNMSSPVTMRPQLMVL